MIYQVEPNFDEDEKISVLKYLDSNPWLTENKITSEFENKISNHINRNYAVSVPNGTIAIYLSLLALGLNKNSRIAVPNLTMIATINAVLWLEATPILIDINKELCMDIEKLKAIKNLDAVIYVPLNGRTSNGLEIQKFCKDSKIFLIEDSAHALGSKYDDKISCGKLGDLSIFSFTPHKIISTGQGGMIMTDNKKYYQILLNLKTFNRKKDKQDWHNGFGLNFKTTDLQSVIGLTQFKKIENFYNKKREIYSFYKNLIKNPKVIVKNFKNFELPWFFDIEVSTSKERANLKNYLSKYGIETRDCYPALSKQKFLKTTEKSPMEISTEIYKNLLWLPSSTKLSEKNLKLIVNTINNY